jgi:hypothetical protein
MISEQSLQSILKLNLIFILQIKKKVRIEQKKENFHQYLHNADDK